MISNKKWKWTKDEDNFLKENFHKLSIDKLINNLQRSRNAILHRSNMLGLYKRKKQKSKRWTKEEEDKLIKIYPQYGKRKTAELLNRSIDSIAKKASQLQISKYHQWKRLDQGYVIKQYCKNKKSTYDIANELNTNVWNIYTILDKNNIKIEKRQAKFGSNHYYWQGYGEIHKSQWGQIIRSAKERNIEFSITIKYAWNLFLKQKRKCALSNIDIKFSKRSHRYFLETTASLDRIDSTKGYIKGNVQWIHKKLQFVKGAMLKEELLQWCKLILENNNYIISCKSII